MSRNNFVMPSGAARAPTMRGSAELEHAKTVLRRAGRVVYNASVDGGPKGLIRVDGREFDHVTVISMAARLPK